MKMVGNLEVYEAVKSEHECRTWSNDEVQLFKNLHQTTEAKHIGTLLGRSKQSIWGKAHLMGLKLFDPKLVRPELSPSKPLSYVLGVLKGDGSVNVDQHHHYLIRLQVKDKVFAESFKEALSEIGLHPNLRFKESEVRPAYTVYAYSKILVKWYSSLSLKDIKTLIGAPSFALGFVKGFYESEGSFVHVWREKRKKHQWRLAIYNNDQVLLLMTCQVLKELGFNFHLQKGILHKPHMFRGHLIVTKKPVYSIDIQSKNEISDFLSLINPCIKADKKKLLKSQEGAD